MTTVIRLSLFAALLPISLFAFPALAHEGVEHTTDTEAAAHLEVAAEVQTAPLVKPLDAVKARAQEIKQNAMRTPGNASGTPPLKIMERQIGARAVETGSSTPRGQLVMLVRTHIGNVVQRLSSVLTHLTRFLDRIDARIEKMEANGADVEAIVVLHTDAVEAVATAEADVAALKTIIGSVSDAEDRAAVRARIDAAVRTARESVREAHEAVRTVVTALVAAAKADASAEAEVEVE